MSDVQFSKDVRPITELKVKAAALVDQVHATGRPLLLTRRGKGVAVLLDLGEYEKLVDRQRFTEAIEAGLAAVAAGDLHDDEDAEKILSTFGE